MNWDNKKTIEGKIIEERFTKSDKLWNKKYFIIAFYIFIGALIMLLITFLFNKNKLINVVNENIKTTTLEEVSDLKSGINSVYESVVYIEVSTTRGVVSSGSGFVYKKENKDAYILTNYHVIEGGNSLNVTFSNGKELSASLINGDEYYDIAILKVDGSDISHIATLGDSSSLELGDTVFTVGAPLGKEYMGTITKGIVSGINRMVSVNISNGSYLMEVIQTDASINSGNSGGPICNIKGEVIGITSSKLVGSGVEGMGFAIPINSVNSIIDSIEKGSSIERPYLGVQLVDLSNTFALQYYYGITIGNDVKFGAVLSYIEEGKTANKAGLEIGDVIVEMDGEKIEDVSHFKYNLYKHSIGDKITIKYYRNNKLNEVTLELNESIKNE